MSEIIKRISIPAIIIPLNKFFYNYEKNNGTSSFERFFNKHLILERILLNPKCTGVAITIAAYLTFVFYVGPVMLWHYVRSGRSGAKNKGNAMVDKMEEYVKNIKFTNIYPTIDKFHHEGYAIFIYYNKNMIPKKKVKQKIFFKKLEKMKSELHLASAFEANTKEDIEKAILTNNINISESFFMTDGRIDLSQLAQLEETVY